jgi:uncharacterized protein YdeI (YjbR/CyaY-like superfamily)
MTKLHTFASAGAFRKWLEANHAKEAELLVRCYKTRAQEKGITYREALSALLLRGEAEQAGCKVTEGVSG